MNKQVYRCRKCRLDLQIGSCVLTTFSSGETSSSTASCTFVKDGSVWYINQETPPQWITALINQASWMKGKLICPKCDGRLGSFDFMSPLVCPCREHVLPAIHILKDRVDNLMVPSAKHMELTGKEQGCPSSVARLVNAEVSKGGNSPKQTLAEVKELPEARENKGAEKEELNTSHSFEEDQLDSLFFSELETKQGTRNQQQRSGYSESSESLSENIFASAGLRYRQKPTCSTQSVRKVWGNAGLLNNLENNLFDIAGSGTDDSSNTSSIKSHDEPHCASHDVPEDRLNVIPEAYSIHSVQLKETNIRDNGSENLDVSHSMSHGRSYGAKSKRRRADNRFSPLVALETKDKSSNTRSIRSCGESYDASRDVPEDRLNMISGRSDTLGVQLEGENVGYNSSENLDRPHNMSHGRSHSNRHTADNGFSSLVPDRIEAEEEEIAYPFEFTCPVCYELYCSPHACFPCGHIYCESCLRQIARSFPLNTQCPMCRKVIGKCKPDNGLTNQIQSLFPEEYKKRQHALRKINKRFYQLPGTWSSSRAINETFRAFRDPARERLPFLHLLGCLLSAVFILLVLAIIIVAIVTSILLFFSLTKSTFLYVCEIFIYVYLKLFNVTIPKPDIGKVIHYDALISNRIIVLSVLCVILFKVYRFYRGGRVNIR